MRVNPQLREQIRTRRRAVDEGWRARHPDRAAAEDLLARANAAALADYGHKRNGTSETWHKASGTRQGAVARLYQAGHLSLDQLAWAQEIAQVHRRIVAGVTVGSMSLETRVDQSRGGAFFEAIGAVWAEMAYTAWRAALPVPAPVLAVVVEETSCRAAARRGRMRDVTLRAMVGEALDYWPECFSDAQNRVDHEDLQSLHGRIS